MAATDIQAHGNFIAFLLREKEPGDKHPMFEGRLSLPDDPKVEYGFPLFAHEYTDPKTGEVMTMFNGGTDPVSLNAAPMDQIAALLKGADATTALTSVGSLQLRPRQLVLFPNRFKNEAPEKERPDYWGAYNHGNDPPVLRIGAWLRKDRYGRAMFGGRLGCTRASGAGRAVARRAAGPALAHGVLASGKTLGSGSALRASIPCRSQIRKTLDGCVRCRAR